MNNEKKPAIRFKGFTNAWEQKRLGEVTSYQISSMTSDSVLEQGIYPVYDANSLIGYTNSYCINEDFITIIKDGSGVGRTRKIKKNCYFIGTMGGILPKYSDISFIYALLQKFNFSLYINGATIPHVYYSDYCQEEITVPNITEQQQIGTFFTHIDSLITLYKRKCEKLQDIKKSCLEKMFPKNGEVVPEIRFKGFTNAWEQRRFGDLVLIERGGSPRPIDAYITDASDGLNWIKIGDAPAQGNYINKTSEKIKPSGLSKTRQVQSGDLILSNSMSFGKPYIMAIDGCIHDGWLLIRNTQNIFDLKFLCHLLGTTQMLYQYKAFAAGSTVNNLNKELVGNTQVTIPAIDEQRVLGTFFTHLDSLITFHQRKCEKLQNIKKSCLEKMFPN